MARLKFSYPAYRQPSHVTFGTGSVRELVPRVVPERTVVLVSAAPRVRQIVEAAFEAKMVSPERLQTLSKPAGEPEPAMIAKASEWLAAYPADTVVAVGGGSVLDWARLALAASRGWLDPATGHMRTDVQPRERPTLILVPTTCGSGAEAASVAVYIRDGRKVPVVSDAFLADGVILDGQFLADASSQWIASWVADAISHSVESFVSVIPNPFAKEAALGALQMILQSNGIADPRTRRQHLMEAGFLAGAAASNCSVGVTHAFAHTLARYGVPHGVANALGLEGGIRTNAATPEMRTLVDRLGLPAAEDLIERIVPLIEDAITPDTAARMRALGTGADRVAIADGMAADVCLRTNPRRLDRAELLAFVDSVAGVPSPA